MWKQFGEQVGRSIEAQREQMTMALYMAIIILSVLVFDKPAESGWEDVRLIVGSAVGILAAHVLAFRLSATYHDKAHEEATEQPSPERVFSGVDISTFALIRATLVVVILACLPYLFLPLEAARWVAFILLALIVGLAAFSVGGASGRSKTRSMLYAGIVTVLAIAIAALKNSLSH